MFTFVWFSKSFGESIVRVRTTHFLKRGVMNSRRSDFQSKAQSGELYNYVAVCKENIWWIKYTANTNALASNTFKTCTWTCNHWKWGTKSEASSSTQLGLHHCFYNFINLHLTVKINPFVLTTAQDFLSFIFDPDLMFSSPPEVLRQRVLITLIWPNVYNWTRTRLLHSGWTPWFCSISKLQAKIIFWWRERIQRTWCSQIIVFY